MTDRYAHYLQDFDPFEGKPPDFCSEDFAKVLSQARRHLRKRRPRDIQQAVAELDRAIEHVSREDARTFIQQNYVANTGANFSYEYRLNAVFQRNYLPDKSDEGHFTPREYGAALAIAVVASTRPELHVRMLLREMITTSSTQRDEDYPTFANKQLLLARHALRIGTEPEKPGKSKARPAPDSKALKNQLKEDFIRFYLAGDFASRSDAARLFHRKLSSKKRRLVGDSDQHVVRFYTTALRRHMAKKGK